MSRRQTRMPPTIAATIRRIADAGPPEEAPLRLALAVGDADVGRVDDRDWFSRHHGRNHRLRRPLCVAEHLLCPRDAGARPIVLVRQAGPGERCRAFAAVRGPLPLNAEAVAARLFDRVLADAREVTILDTRR